MADDIRVFRFVTGEFVVANFIKEDEDGGYTIQDPLFFMVGARDKEGKVPIQIQPVIPMGKPGESIDISVSDIMFFIKEPDEIILEAFTSATSLIDKPDNTIVLPGQENKGAPDLKIV